MVPRRLAFFLVLMMTMNTVFTSDLEGPNVCTKTQEIPVTIKVSYPVPYEVKTFAWCARIPPRCPKTRTAYKTGYRDETKLTNQTIRVCCEGFAELEGRCLPQEIHYHIGNSTTTLRIVKEFAPPEQSASDAGLWAGISMILLLVVATSLFLLMRYKKKLHRVKEELQYVSYTVDRLPGDRFDNPLYAQSSNAASSYQADGSTLNDLGGTKINNLAVTSGKVPCFNNPNEYEPAGAASSDLESYPKQNCFNTNIARKSESVKDLDKEPIYEDIDKYAKPESVYDEPSRAARPVASSEEPEEMYNAHSIASSTSTNDDDETEMDNSSKSENTELKKA